LAAGLSALVVLSCASYLVLAASDYRDWGLTLSCTAAVAGLALVTLRAPENRRGALIYAVGTVGSLAVLVIAVWATGGADSPLSALAGSSLLRTVVLAATSIAAGVAAMLVVNRLRETVALDADRLETIVALHHELEGAQFDVDGVVLEVLDRARILLGASAASAGIIEGDQIVYKYRTGPGRRGGTITTPLDVSLSGVCIRTGEPEYCEDSEQDPRVDRAACRAQGLRSMIIVPLRHRCNVVGVLNVNSPEIAAFDATDVRTVQLIAGAIAAAYGHAVDVAAKQELLTKLEATVTALRDSEARLSFQALHDPLTGLPNRTLFLDRLRTALAGRRDPEVAVLFVDLDGFKPVNDTLGHEAGDALLVEAARRIKDALRVGDTAARLGGDEFAVICRDARQPSAGARVAERLLALLQAPFEVVGREALVSASIGVAAHSGSAECLLRDADIAMYCAKAAGKARHQIFEPAMRTKAEARLRERTLGASDTAGSA
jgi:diguanylate cyclase (GGDEF)-like protein